MNILALISLLLYFTVGTFAILSIPKDNPHSLEGILYFGLFLILTINCFAFVYKLSEMNYLLNIETASKILESIKSRMNFDREVKIYFQKG